MGGCGDGNGVERREARVGRRSLVVIVRGLDNNGGKGIWVGWISRWLFMRYAGETLVYTTSSLPRSIVLGREFRYCTLHCRQGSHDGARSLSLLRGLWCDAGEEWT